jgi:hypothetical protein
MKGRQGYNKTTFRTKDALPAGTITVSAGADLAYNPQNEMQRIFKTI